MRKAGASNQFRGGSQQVDRPREPLPGKEGDEAIQNAFRRLAMKLLMRNGARQCFKRRSPGPKRQRIGGPISPITRFMIGSALDRCLISGGCLLICDNMLAYV